MLRQRIGLYILRRLSKIFNCNRIGCAGIYTDGMGRQAANRTDFRAVALDNLRMAFANKLHGKIPPQRAAGHAYQINQHGNPICMGSLPCQANRFHTFAGDISQVDDKGCSRFSYFDDFFGMRRHIGNAADSQDNIGTVIHRNAMGNTMHKRLIGSCFLTQGSKLLK